MTWVVCTRGIVAVLGVGVIAGVLAVLAMIVPFAWNAWVTKETDITDQELLSLGLDFAIVVFLATWIALVVTLYWWLL